MRTKGKITSWNDEKGFGFITPNSGGKRVFVHIKAFGNRNRRPEVNQTVMRPNLVGGAAVLAEAIATAGNRIDVAALIDYAQDLGWAAALRRIGSVADTLEVGGLAGRLHPLKPITADLDLEPGGNMSHCWRDAHWRVRWQQMPDEIASVVKQ